MSWVFFTVLAAFMQTWRNALQSKLSKNVNTSGVTLARFLFASPIAAIYLLVLYQFGQAQIPDFTGQFGLIIGLASILQITATSLMVILFKQKNFAVGAGLAKSEALVAGVLGTLFFGSQLTLLGWAGILVGTLSIFVLSGLLQKGNFSLKTVGIGLACGTSFALTSLFVREAAHALNVPFPYSAAWVLLWVLAIQTLTLSAYILWRKPFVFAQLKENGKLTLATSLTSCIGSIGWFSAMALQHVAYVKTLGQIEVLFTILLSAWWLKQPVKRNELIGLILISVAAVMVMWS